MWRPLHYLRDWGAAGAAASIAAVLIVLKLWSAGWISPMIAAFHQPGVVQNYVLFTQVDSDGITVTTGTKYSDNSGRSIESQWCYLNSQVIDFVRVEVATADSSGIVTPATPSQAGLDALGITLAQARLLADTHCHFQ